MDNKRQKHYSYIPFRIRIGVTGHRKIQDTEELRGKIRKILDIHFLMDKNFFDKDSKKFIQASPHTPIAFGVVSPLAEGADRFVAKEVLRLPNSILEVVLPLAKEDYIKDFKTEESCLEFEELLSKASRIITLKKRPLHEEITDSDLKEVRPQAYKAVGQYVVDCCDLLIALWDGRPPQGIGGTAEIVNYAREKTHPMIIISPVPPYNNQPEKGLGLNVKSIIEIERFNAYPIREKVLKTYSNNLYNDLFNKNEAIEIPNQTKRTIIERLLPFYVRASLIAKKNQKKDYWAGLVVYTLSALAFISITIETIVHKFSIPAYALELLFLFSILVYVFFTHRKKFHEKWIESRFLVERIRAAIFFAVCDTEPSPIRVPSYMGIAHHPDDWMLKTFYEIWNRIEPVKKSLKKSWGHILSFVKKLWIEDQILYHKKNFEKLQKKNRRLEVAGNMIFFAAAIVAFLHIVFCLFGHEPHTQWYVKVLTFLALILPILGASLHGLRAHREYLRLEKRSKNMMAVLNKLNERFQSISNYEGFESLLYEMDELMLRESQDWLMLMRFVKLETVA